MYLKYDYFFAEKLSILFSIFTLSCQIDYFYELYGMFHTEMYTM